MPSPRRVLVWASASQASVSVVNFGLPSIGPELRAEFGLSLAELGAVLTASLFGSGIALYAAGIVVDRSGGRRATLAGSAIGACSLAAAAFAPSAGVLIALLVLSGIGMAAIPIAGIGSLFRVYPTDRRGFALGVRQMAVPLGGVIGAVLLPVLDAVGGARLAIGACAVPVAIAGILFATVAGGVPAAHERPPMGLRRIWSAPGFQRLLVVAAFYIVVLQALLSFTVPAARDAGLSTFAAGAAFFVLNVTAGVARIVWGRLADRDGGTRRVRDARPHRLGRGLGRPGVRARAPPRPRCRDRRRDRVRVRRTRLERPRLRERGGVDSARARWTVRRRRRHARLHTLGRLDPRDGRTRRPRRLERALVDHGRAGRCRSARRYRSRARAGRRSALSLS